MDKIEKKIQEVNFFYDKMKESTEFPIVFEYYLSAFLSASRSVLQYIFEEAKNDKIRRCWYDNRVSQNNILKYFKDKRDTNIHAEQVKSKIGIDIQLVNNDSGTKAIAVFCYHFDDYTGEDVLGLCDKYLNELTKIKNEFYELV